MIAERADHGAADGGCYMDVTIARQKDSDRRVLDAIYDDEVVRRELWLEANADAWIPPFRKHLKDARGFGFPIRADGEVVREIVLEDPSICRSTYTVGFAIARDRWNQGICTSALEQVVRFAFEELGLHKAAGDCDSDNPASGRVMEKVGFTREGVLKEHVYKNGRYVDRIHYGIINPA